MRLVVGLGNPGKAYEKTRHNIGFMVLDNYLSKKNLTFSDNKYEGVYTKTVINGEDVIFLKPQSYINLSGEVIIKFMNFYKIPVDNIFIIHDDLDIECGNYKLRYKGSSGGHNGLKNIELHTGTQNYKRLRVGISNNKMVDAKDYVLGKLNKEQQEKIDEVIDMSVNIIDDYFEMEFDNLMNKYN